MTFLLILVGVVAVLLTGLPVFTGLGLFAGGLLLATQGDLGGIGDIVFGQLDSYLLVAIPLFTLMAHIMIRGRVVDDLYETAHTLLRHLPGGIGIATVFACTIFAAISGSSIATALTIGAVAIPQMIHYGYSPRMAYGVVAAGGTLGILIPPSGPMVLYGVISDTSIGGLFMAGILPGVMIAGLFALWCAFADRGQRLRPPRASLSEMARALRRSGWALSLPVFVLGGMYAGVFTATEAAAAGGLAALLVSVIVYRNFGIRDLWASAMDAARTSAMLFMILAAAGVFGHVLTKMRVPQELVELVVHWEVGVAGFLIAMMLLIALLGMFLETISIILITTPVVLPVLAHLGINPIWYGILLTINLEMALITPPVGMNLFTIKAITHVPMGEIIRGVAPYVLLMVLGLGLVMIWPDIALWLPSTMALR
ncbi:C4-dicarboxylate ABC transporter permease [Tistrella bauzanensis]|uniref:TRAP transporter large permease protein n=1 Tax=Tistrella bauzanensis TaxID=657419 RepID=A0ABQ1INH0_9PROT|nr:TRAP transporter large permease [Tistrella bauzanensis]GGB47766.1 C4-dicarboxylate ABC transporter permease [Tistrella bauzanensis]